MNFDPHAYNVTVRRILIDGETTFEARVFELPDVSGFGESAVEAYNVAIEAIDALHEIADAEGTDFPAPAEPEVDFSGRVTLRMSKSMHRAVAQRATSEDVSLNSYIVECVALRLQSGVGMYEPTARHVIYDFGLASTVGAESIAGLLAGVSVNIITTGGSVMQRSDIGADVNIEPAANITWKVGRSLRADER